jgi:hypothetical protein
MGEVAAPEGRFLALKGRTDPPAADVLAGKVV